MKRALTNQGPLAYVVVMGRISARIKKLTKPRDYFRLKKPMSHIPRLDLSHS